MAHREYFEYKDAKLADFSVRSSGASKVTLSGSTDKLYVRMSGASRIDAAELNASVGNVKGSGASSLKGNFSETLKVKASGASRVKYKGEATVTKKVSGAGKISNL